MATQRKKPAARGKRARYWSQHVTQTSHAMDLEKNVFAKRSPRAVAQSLRRSVERSTQRKSPPFQSAMSMLSFYVNRAGKQLSAARKSVLMRAKVELRRLYGKR